MNTYEIESLSAMKRGAVTLCLGSSTGANITGSLQVAGEIAKVLKRGKVLYLNTIQTKRQIGDGFKKMLDIKLKENAKTNDPIECITTTVGHLSNFENAVRKSLECGVKFVIINSLEFSSKDYRRKDDLIFQILEWTNIYGVGVLVFAEAPKNAPQAGKIQRGGCAGKLAAVTKSIFLSVEPEEQYAETPEEVIDMKDIEEELENIPDEDIPFLNGTASNEEIFTEWMKIAPENKPRHVNEEIRITNAYMRNHPEFKTKKGEAWGTQRERILVLLDRAKKRRQALIDSLDTYDENDHEEDEVVSDFNGEEEGEELVRDAMRLIGDGGNGAREKLFS